MLRKELTASDEERLEKEMERVFLESQPTATQSSARQQQHQQHATSVGEASGTTRKGGKRGGYMRGTQLWEESKSHDMSWYTGKADELFGTAGRRQ